MRVKVHTMIIIIEIVRRLRPERLQEHSTLVNRGFTTSGGNFIVA